MKQHAALQDGFDVEAEPRQGESDAQTLAALGTSLIGADIRTRSTNR